MPGDDRGGLIRAGGGGAGSDAGNRGGTGVPAPWEFATAGRIVFGAGTRHQLPAILRTFGNRALLVGGRHLHDNHADAASGMLMLPDLGDVVPFVVNGEPTIDVVRRGAELFRAERCEVVIGIGGGSVLDAAKAIAALATNRGDALDYLEVIGRGQPLEQPPAPCIAAPTTAGTGSEVTRNAVLGSPEHGVKASLRHASMLPRVAVIDPELTLTLPPAVTASTGLDALTQVIEPYVSPRATPMTDAFCLEGIRRVARALRIAAGPEGASRLDARIDMSLASLFGGLALANAGLGVIHGFAAPIGGMFSAPHGAVCAALLPHGMTANLQALRVRAKSADGAAAAALAAIDRYRMVAVTFTGDSEATPEAGIAAVASLCADLRIPGLRAYGINETHAEELARKALNSSSMKANPITLGEAQMHAVLLAAL
jgi:alcohol dehydrogenase class IV